MKIAVIGTGYVGLVAGAGFSEFGNDVTCVDVDAARVAALTDGKIPIYEPGLEDLVHRNAAEGRLQFTTALAPSVAGADVVIIAVGTPQGTYGLGANLEQVWSAGRDVARALTGFAVVATKSTVPVGTADRLKEILAAESAHPFAVASNPEFLKEGDAVNDFMKPSRIIIGCNDERGIAAMRNLYAPFVRTGDRILVMDVRSAELSKYAANAMLATRISFMNELARLAEVVGADIESVRTGIGSDPRIGSKFLFPGPGFGGSCLVGRESVLIRQNGEVRLARLDSLIDAPSTPSAAASAPEGLEVLAVRSSNAPPEFLPVLAITCRPYEGELVDVRTKMGRRVRCTPDHPFVTLTDEGVPAGIARADELTDSTWLPLAGVREAAPASAAPRANILACIDALEIPASHVIVQLGRDHVRASQATEALRRVMGSSPRLWDVRSSGTVRLTEALEAGLDLENARVGTCRSGTYIPARIELSPAFWRVMGLYCAEGWISSDAGRDGAERLRISWAFHPHEEDDLVEEVAGFWQSIGVKAQIRAGSTTRNVSISSRLLARWILRSLQTGHDCYSKRVPGPLWDADDESKKMFLSGLWNGDGSWSYVANRRGAVLEYGTVSRFLADGVLRLLAEQGVVASWKIGRPPKSTVDTHFVRISGADQVERVLWLAKAKDHDRIRDAIAAQTKRIRPTGFRSDSSAGAQVRVVSLHRQPFRGHVYSLEVPDAGTFVTTAGLVVHNCFPKDIRALAHTAHGHGIELSVVEAADRANERQKRLLGARVRQHFGGASLSGRRIALWGLAFKPGTDDVRESPALAIADDLVTAGAEVTAYDPAAAETFAAQMGRRVSILPDMYAAVDGADALVLVTEWKQFRRPDFARIKTAMRGTALFDGRNIWNPAELTAQGFQYYGIGRPRARTP